MLKQQTKVQAVNQMLAAVGESPINNLEADLAEAQTAIDVLDDVSRELQTRGWGWNRQVNRKIKRSATNEVYLPGNTLSVDIKDEYTKRPAKGSRVAFRNGKLYDLVNFTYEFENDPCLDIVLGLDFDELPENARRAIVLDATARYTQIVIGVDSDTQFLTQQAIKAFIQLEQEEDLRSDYNIVTDNPLTSYTTDRVRYLS